MKNATLLIWIFTILLNVGLPEGSSPVQAQQHGFRGMTYDAYELNHGCWSQGPKAGLPKNDSCIAYESGCPNIIQGEKSTVTVSKLDGDTITERYNAGFRVYVCGSFIHLPPEPFIEFPIE